MTRVALIGGFGTPTVFLRPLRNALRAAGHDVFIAPLGFNVDCGEVTVQRLDTWLASIGVGQPVVVVGHSRGGQLGRVLAVRRPELVSRLVTVNTPWSIGPPDRPGVAVMTNLLQRARGAGLPVMGSLDSATGSCCTDYRADLAKKPPAPWTALWSATDRVAGDDGRPPRAADNVIDTRTSHVGAVTSDIGINAIADAITLRR